MNKIALHLQVSNCGEGCTSKQAGCGGIVVSILFPRLGSNETLGQGSGLESAQLSPRLDVRCSMFDVRCDHFLQERWGVWTCQKIQSCRCMRFRMVRASRVLFWEKAGVEQTTVE